MQERHHVKTTPGEPHAVPEFTPHPVRREEGGNVQMDDINIPLVAVIVAFFAVLLAVIIVSLQGWFYSRQSAERQAKMLPRDDPRTELGALWQVQRADLNGPAGPARTMPAAASTGPATANASAAAPRERIPIEDAIKIVAKEWPNLKTGESTK